VAEVEVIDVIEVADDVAEMGDDEVEVEAVVVVVDEDMSRTY
jgi:hypothetical protein